MADLLTEESLAWCGIWAGLDFRRRELGFEPSTPNLSWKIHLGGGVFALECELCASSSRGCQTAKGRKVCVLLSFGSN